MLLGGSALLLGGLLRPGWIIRWMAARSPGVLYFVESERPAVALTIDDAPDPVATPRILDVLARHGARATFFVITDYVAGNEALLRRMVAEGHELANHLTRDEASARLLAAAFEEELARAHDVLSPYGPIQWFRPGGGRLAEWMPAAVERAGYRSALGSVYPFDAAIPWSGFAARYILWNATPGAVIVLHDRGLRGPRTAATLERVLPALRARGLAVVTLSELVE